jgi:uncharacterized protein
MESLDGVTVKKYPDGLPALELPQKIKAALADFQRQLLQLFQDEIMSLILYGSYARDEATPESDVDVMVVVNWKNPDQPGGYYLGGAADPRWQQIIDAAVDAMIAHGPFISALVVGESLFNSNWDVAQSARREGKVLWTNSRRPRRATVRGVVNFAS